MDAVNAGNSSISGCLQSAHRPLVVSQAGGFSYLPQAAEVAIFIAQGLAMTSTTFDTLGYFEKLKAAGVPEAQAKVQVEVMQDVIKSHDAVSRKDLATKGDLADTKHDILKWVIGVAIGQSALIIAVLALLRP